jgi:hypothetical protein
MTRKLVALTIVTALVILACLPGCNASCRPMEVRGLSTTCGGGARGYMWTGTGCIYTVACNCTGADCQRLYETQDGCETAHIHCRPATRTPT